MLFTILNEMMKAAEFRRHGGVRALPGIRFFAQRPHSPPKKMRNKAKLPLFTAIGASPRARLLATSSLLLPFCEGRGAHTRESIYDDSRMLRVHRETDSTLRNSEAEKDLNEA